MLLAAGASSRLGKPKQLLKYNDTTFLKYVVQKALDSNANAVVVVLGANANVLIKEIENENINIAINDEWEEGMASSMIKGLDFLLKKYPSTDGVIFMMCDQPFVSISLLNDLIVTQRATSQPIVASNYGNTIGPPALFHKSIFFELLELEGDIGAKKIIEKHADEVVTVYFPGGNIDIDTLEDYEALLRNDE